MTTFWYHETVPETISGTETISLDSCKLQCQIFETLWNSASLSIWAFHVCSFKTSHLIAGFYLHRYTSENEELLSMLCHCELSVPIIFTMQKLPFLGKT
jgi:hypothetical protein